MHKAHNIEDEDVSEYSSSTEVSIPLSIKDLVEIRERIIQAWSAVNIAIDEIDHAFASIHDKDFHFMRDSSGNRWDHRQDKVEIKEETEYLDYSLFVFALEKLNITNAMTSHAKDKFLKQIKEKKTKFEEHQLRGLAQNAHFLFRDSSLNTVREVYRQLIGVRYNGADWGGDKKDNLRKVEKVFRVGSSDITLKNGWKGERYLEMLDWRSDSAASGFRFNDLLTACRLIEGEGIPDYSNNLSFMLRSSPNPDRTYNTINTGYFLLQAYLNRNVKVKWSEDKLHILDKLNAIGSGKSADLPDVQRKRYKAEHFHNNGTPEAEDYFKPDPKAAPSDEKDFAFYPTPEEVVDRMVELAEYPETENWLGAGPITLEPSAGDGAILRRAPFHRGCVAVEFNHHRAAKLRAMDSKWTIHEDNFLDWETDPIFDRVLMNPPFNDRLEAEHMVKAFGHLQPGGILVGILPEGWFARDDLKSTILRAWLKKNEHKPPESLPPGTFGRTKIVTRIVILKKQANG